MSKSLFAITEWITKFAILNIIWMLFSALGLILFGFFPATVAMFAVIRKWLTGYTNIPVFKYFWKIYKKEFWKANLIGVIVTAVALIVYVDFYYIQANTELSSLFIHIPLYLFIFAFMLTLLYLFPVYVHYDVTFFQVFKNALLIMFIHPIHNIGLIASIAITYLVMSYIPGLAFFFGGSFIAYLIMGTCYNAFQRIDRKKRTN